MPNIWSANMGRFVCVASSLSASTACARAALWARLAPGLGSSGVPSAGGTSPPLRPSPAAFSVGITGRGSVWGRRETFLSTIHDGRVRRTSTSREAELAAGGGVAQRKSFRLDDAASDTKRPPEASSAPPSDDIGRDSLANLASSPERFAASLGISPEQVDEAVRARRAASAALHARLVALERDHEGALTPGEIGRLKHEMTCRHRRDNLRRPWICRRCWTHLPICVCPLFEGDATTTEEGDPPNGSAETKRSKAPLPAAVDRVVLWTHHDEWGRTSNTGSLLPLGLERTDMLMKGLPEHDDAMGGLLGREDLTPVVLWPGKSRNDNTTTTVEELRRRFVENECDDDGNNNNSSSNNNETKIVLISVEGTWNTARKMVNKLPPNVLRLDLADEVAANFSIAETNGGIFRNSTHYPASLSAPESAPLSLLAPLRRQREGKRENVSTVEATLVALVALGLRIDDAARILRIARVKVDRVMRYTGKTHRNRQ